MGLSVELVDGALVLVGDLDRRSVATARDALHGALRAGGDVVVDLSGVRLVDSCGLGLIVSAHRLALTSGRRVVLRGVGPTLARVLAVTRLHRVLHLERRPGRRDNLRVSA